MLSDLDIRGQCLEHQASSLEVLAFEVDAGQVLRSIWFQIQNELETPEYEDRRDDVFSVRRACINQIEEQFLRTQDGIPEVLIATSQGDHPNSTFPAARQSRIRQARESRY
jgi:hypothetical protein